MKKRCLLLTDLLMNNEIKDDVFVSGIHCFPKEDLFSGNKQRHNDLPAPYGLDPKQRVLDLSLTLEIERTILGELLRILNKIHNVQYDLRSWRILVGNWVRRYSQVIVNRVNSTQELVKNLEPNYCLTINTDENYVFSLDTNDALLKFSDSYWNEFICQRIISDLQLCEIKTVQYVHKNPNSSDLQKNSLKDLIKCSITNFNSMTNIFRHQEDNVIINSYLSKWNEIKLQVALGQIPMLNFSKPEKLPFHLDKNLRARFAEQVIVPETCDAKQLALALLRYCLPSTVLENFKFLQEISKKRNWPMNPRFIFTSNSFDVDEVFKFWTVSKVQSGSKLFIGQHGNTYGINKFYGITNEEIVCDKFFTWGWQKSKDKHVPLFNLKSPSAGRTINHFKKSKKTFLLNMLHVPHRMNTWDDFSEYSKYYGEVFNFVDELSSQNQKRLNVRLHTANSGLRFHEEHAWKTNFPEVKIEGFGVHFNKSRKSAALLINSYDSTGLLEALSDNMPTIGFWQNKIEHVDDFAVSDYEKLQSVGIIHFTPRSAAAHINEYANNIERWWNDPITQGVINEFVNKYSRRCDSPIKGLLTQLLQKSSPIKV